MGDSSMEMINLSIAEKECLKRIQLELLDEISSFCKKNNLTFYLASGTLLGAIRHHGYIPWDDDIDICMPREDYDKLCKLYPKNEKFFLQTPETDKCYFYHFGKFMRKHTIYNEYCTQHLKGEKGIFIDIFPINGYPEKKGQAFFYKFWLFVLNKKSYPRKMLKLRDIKRNIGYRCMTLVSWILLWWAPYNMCAKMRDNFIKKHQYKNSKLCSVGTNLRRIFLKEYFQGVSMVKFEGRELPAMQNYDGYLRTMYGEYMLMPDETERIGHHFLVEFKGE